MNRLHPQDPQDPGMDQIPIIKQQIAENKGLHDQLFALMMLGDKSNITQT